MATRTSSPLSFLLILDRYTVITGYNTDIEFEGVTYHVQTEDKGLAKPIILSLVYDRGTILASKRLPYDDLLVGTFDEEILAARLSRQHTLICAAIQAGRIEDLRQMTLRESVAAADASKAVFVEPVYAEASVAAEVDEFEELFRPIPKPRFGGILDVPIQAEPVEPIARPTTVLTADDVLLPDEAVEIVSEMLGSERPANNKLSIELLGEARFKGGERKSVTFLICRGTERKVIHAAQVMVKILGSSFRPLIFHASTDENGVAKVNLQLPNFNSGRAALLVRAVSDGEEVELRRAITHG
ncbi:MAG: hypothetical protein DMF63_01170 [Acidobacteria bacterium]|nr:MAG: hypothetical protein DMF63_01170 [Acidobacteriota bacterium]